MSSNSFASTVDLTLRPSARAVRLLFWLHGAPLVLLPFAMQPGMPMLLIAAAMAASWFWLRRHPSFGHGPRALTRLIWHAEGHWSLMRGSAQAAEAELLGNTYVQSWILILNFRTGEGRRYTRILFGDDLPADALRRLRARLQTWTPHISPTP